MATLSLVQSIRHGGFDRIERRYLDYLIDGRSLRTFLPVGAVSELISPFGWQSNHYYVREQVEQLTLVRDAELRTGRVRLYVCPECGDIDCTSISVEVVDLDDKIRWQHFASETGYGGIMESWPDIDPITFDRIDYMRTFMRLYIRLH